MLFTFGQFGGECSIEEVTKHEKEFGLSNELDCLIAVGGGKCIGGRFINGISSGDNIWHQNGPE